MTEQATLPNQTNNATEDGGDWRTEYLADNPDLQNDPILKDIPDIATLAKVARDEKKAIGGMSKLPTEKSTPEEWDKFFNKIGRPEKVDGYKIDKNILPENIPLDENRLKSFLPFAHRIGLTNKQVQELVKFTGEEHIQTSKISKEKQLEALSKLKEELGKNYEKETSIARKASDKFCTSEEKKYFEDTGYGNDPVLIKMFARIGKETLEDSTLFVPGQSNTESIKEEINKIRADKNHPFNNIMHPGHAQAHEQMLNLYKQLASRG